MSNKGKLFYAEASKGYIIKVLVDVLSATLQRGYFTLSEEGIRLRQCDTEKTVMFDVFLPRTNLRKYKCTRDFTISLNLKHLQKLLKNVKKKDSISMSIDKDHENKFIFTIKPEGTKGSSRFENNEIVFQEEKDYVISGLPDGGYKYPMVIEASDFQKIKRLTTVGKNINVTMQEDNYLCFACDAGDIFSSQLGFGEIASSDEEEDGQEKNLYCKSFFSSIINLLIKLPGLCNQMDFYAPNVDSFPLKIEINAGQNGTTLGTIQVFIKDVDQISYEESIKDVNETPKITSSKAKSKRKT